MVEVGSKVYSKKTTYWMLDQDFCSFLEYRIGEAFENSTHESPKHFWCDGVHLPLFEADYSVKTVNDKRQVVMLVYLGPAGQDAYKLTLKFGKKALSRYARGLDISECVPSPASDNWWDIETDQRTILIQLD
jgi:hypothetical protein